MNRNPTPAQLAAAIAAYDERVGQNPAPNLRVRHAAMLAALRAAADHSSSTGGTHEHMQRRPAG
jgi:hypothetical protein